MDVIAWDFDGSAAPPYRPGPPAGPLNPLFRLLVSPCDWIVTGRAVAERPALSRLTGVREDHIIARDWELPPAEPDYMPRYRAWKLQALAALAAALASAGDEVTIADDDEEIIARLPALAPTAHVVRMIYQSSPAPAPGAAPAAPAPPI